MKEAIVKKDASVDVVDVPVPTPGPDHVLIKVVVAGEYPESMHRACWQKLIANYQ